MSLTETNARLERGMKELAAAWRSATDLWRDDRARAVERELLVPLDGATKQAIEAVSRLQQAVSAAQRECSEV